MSRRRKSRAKTLRNPGLCRRHRFTGSVSPNRWKPGDIVKFCSPMRRRLIPSNCDQHGEVIEAGLWSVTVRFFAFPDEPLYLGLNEIRRASGTRTARERAKTKKKPVRNLSTDWIGPKS
jgi:hypothetical protein